MMEVLTRISFKLDMDLFASKLHIAKGSKDEKEFQNFVNDVTPQINPKAVYKVSYIWGRTFNTLTIDGVTFTSRALRVNLNKAEKVFPYIVTCGTELDEIVLPSGDFVKQFWLDMLKIVVLDNAVRYLKDYLKQKYALERISTMSPGSADPDIWPIEQQKQLFSLFGDVEALIGVKLTESFLMIPVKSLSGILFPTEISFRSCQLCQKENCPSRTAPFNKNLLKSFPLDRTEQKLR